MSPEITVSRDEVERAIFESREKNELDIQSEISYAAEQGEKRGEKRGFKKGRQERAKELLAFIDEGCTLEELRRELEGRGELASLDFG